MPSADLPKWSTKFDTLKREDLLRNPPKSHTAYPALAEAFQPHIGSFNALFEQNAILHHALRDIGTKVFLDGQPGDDASTRNKLSLRIQEFFLDKSKLPPTNKVSTSNREILPAECRERHSTYRGKFSIRLGVKINDGQWKELHRDMGHLPLMIRSSKCHLESFSPARLVQCKEESEEFGGYFIVNGNEKLIRLLVLPKRNFPTAIVRSSFTKRGPTYSEYAVQIRSVRPDQTSQSNVLHYLNDGNVIFRFSWRKNEYLVPLMMILKALVETNDREIFQGLVNTTDEKILKEKQFLVDRVEMLLRTYKTYAMHGKAKARAYLGSKFRPVLSAPEDSTDEEAGAYFLRKIVLPHLGCYDVDESHDANKFGLLLFMLKKLYALVEGECAPDNPDAVSNQEVLLGGFLYGMLLKEKLEDWISVIKIQALEWCRAKDGRTFAHSDFEKEFIPRVLRKTNENIGQYLDYFLSTGNLVSSTGLDLQQTSGFTVVAEKLNFYRFISHFRCIHRGSFFAELKTTTVRKLLPESWGFLCPVHTPDGAPCGLLNHLAHKCKIATSDVDTSSIPDLLTNLGVTSSRVAQPQGTMVIQLNGKILGFCTSDRAMQISNSLRKWKIEGSHGVPKELEVGHVPVSKGGQFPGIYMFSHAARLYRPVKHLASNKLDYIGPFEQPFMSIACVEHEIKDNDFSHVEYDPTNMLSIVANMTPFSDFNQSPRNMYQCQMGKQTMGTPGSAIKYRTDNKLYQLQTGQTPVVRPPLHNEYGLDNFPNGTNAIVAVISYTGYDMDDAMIINKSAHERGFGYGSIYKTKKIDLDEGNRKSRSTKTATKLFGFAPGGIVKSQWLECLDEDGMPLVGREVNEGDIIAASYKVNYDPTTRTLINQDSRTEIHRYKEMETAYVEEVRIHGSEEGNTPCTSISVKFRIPRGSVIGDKFSSRHGQKGVCSQKWPSIDMPFSESGIVPDVIINPHAFPSRMTIGMFIESLAGKSGSLHGFAQDSTPFRFEDRKHNTAVEYFGHQLRTAGYNYHGNEPMYSGITGQELAADIYMGVVYYQRLRHMVNDKFQVRTTGPVSPATGQPIKGRSKGGGIRVGEMERDSLLAHGTAFLMQDRLMNCSDYTKAWVCRQCGAFLSTTPSVGGYGPRKSGTNRVRCRRCATKVQGWRPSNEVWEDGRGVRWSGGEDTTVVGIPGVLRCLDIEMAAVGIRMRLKVKP